MPKKKQLSQGSKPVTKDELDSILDNRLEGTEMRLQQYVDRKTDQVLAAIENIRDELVGGNRDEISAIEDKQKNHEERITVLEQRTGV